MSNSNTFKQRKEKYYSFIYQNGDESSNIIFIGKIKTDIEKICEKISKKKGIDSLTKKENVMMIDFFGKDYIEKLNLNNNYINIYFNKDFLINDDDTIELINNKLMISLFDLGIVVDTNGLLIWNEENNIDYLMTYDYYDKNKNPMLNSNPFTEIYKFSKNIIKEFILEKEILKSMVKYIDHREYILYDFYLTNSKKYYFTDINSVLAIYIT